MRKALFFIFIVGSFPVFASDPGLHDLATALGTSFTQSLHSLLDSMRKPFYAMEMIFLMLYVKSNPKAALGGTGLVAMIYEFAISFSNSTMAA